MTAHIKRIFTSYANWLNKDGNNCATELSVEQWH